jgi:hypothetical protein
MDRDAATETWSRMDRQAAVGPADGAAVDASAALRSLVVDLAGGSGSEDDLFDACARLGRLLAEAGASPTLAAVTLEHGRRALGASPAPAWTAPAHAALAEGYAAALAERAQRDAAAAWEYPRCRVWVAPGVAAIAAGLPDDDEEAATAWSARVARAAALDGARRAIVDGREPARSALVDALELAGIAVEPPARR